MAGSGLESRSLNKSKYVNMNDPCLKVKEILCSEELLCALLVIEGLSERQGAAFRNLARGQGLDYLILSVGLLPTIQFSQEL